MTWIITYKADKLARSGGALNQMGSEHRTIMTDNPLSIWLDRQNVNAVRLRKGGDGEALENIIVQFAAKDQQ